MDLKTKNKITYVNFLLSSFIIFHHAYNVNVYDLSNTLLGTIEKYLLSAFEVAVPLFFIISGYLFFYNCDKTNIKNKLKKRFKSLIVPYLLWNLIGYFYFQIVNLFPFIRDNYFGVIENFSIIGMIKQCFIGDYNTVTWFLRALIIYTYITPIFYLLINKNKTLSYSVLIISFLLCFISKDEHIINYCYYFLGVFFAINYKDFFIKKHNIKSNMLIFLSLLFIFVYFDIIYTNILGRIIYGILSISLWFSLDFFKTLKQPKWFMYNTFFFYCGHEMILEPIEKIFYLLIGNNIFGATLDFVIAPILTIICLSLICYFLNKYFPCIYRPLVGYRN